MTSSPLARVFQCLFTFALVSASRWLAENWQLSRRGTTGELEVEFKFQRNSNSKFPPRRQSAPGSLLAGYEKISVGHSWTTLWNLNLTQFLNTTAESELLLSMTIPGLSTSLTCLSSCTSCMLLYCEVQQLNLKCLVQDNWLFPRPPFCFWRNLDSIQWSWLSLGQ